MLLDMNSFHFYKPSEGHGLAHDPFNAIIAPRPIGWISSKSIDGVLNLAPYSFFNGFNYIPPILGFSSVGRKDSLNNIEATGEFVWNMVNKPLAEQMNITSSGVGPEEDEFKLSGLTPIKGQVVDVPRVGESPVSFECKLTQIVQLQNKEGGLIKTWLVLGEVVGVHINQTLLINGVFDTSLAGPITRGGGPADYFIIGPEQRFLMNRPEGWNRPNK